MAWRKWIAAALVLVILATLGATFRPDRAIRVATSVVADSVCAKTFVSGLDPKAVFAETMDRPGIRRLRAVMRYQLDRTAGIVDVSVMGLLGSRAAFHEGLGCVLLHGSKEPYLLKSDIETLKVPKNPRLLPEIAGPDIVEPSDSALKA
ncbi:MAG TPA: serine hydrolase, partial [Bradyrhizobium sp.]|nr:serine hydrolase [Bradyrhizobium sp.]